MSVYNHHAIQHKELQIEFGSPKQIPDLKMKLLLLHTTIGNAMNKFKLDEPSIIGGIPSYIAWENFAIETKITNTKVITAIIDETVND